MRRTGEDGEGRGGGDNLETNHDPKLLRLLEITMMNLLRREATIKYS
jgi:hypothetical protein